MAGFEAMLRCGRGEGGAEDRKKQTFQDFHLWAQQANRPVGRALVGRFPGLEDRDDMGRLPNCRNVGSPNLQIEKVSGEADAEGSKMLHVKHSEAVGASSRRTFARLNSAGRVRLGERGV